MKNQLKKNEKEYQMIFEFRNCSLQVTYKKKILCK